MCVPMVWRNWLGDEEAASRAWCVGGVWKPSSSPGGDGEGHARHIKRLSVILSVTESGGSNFAFRGYANESSNAEFRSCAAVIDPLTAEKIYVTLIFAFLLRQ